MMIPDSLQNAAVAVLTWATVLSWNAAVTEAAGQVEVYTSPATISLEAQHPTTLSLGVMALDRLVAPAIEGRVLANELLTGAVLRIAPDGSASFTYSDLFTRSFRGRGQYLAHPEDELEDLLRLPAGHPKPKVLLDLYEVRADGLAFDTFNDVLYWAGELVYRFDLGHPVRSLKLASRDGRHRTTVMPGPDAPLQVLASSDGATWVEIWRSDEPVLTEIDAAVPAELLGSGTLYLKLRGTESALLDLYISGEVDATALTPAITVDAGADTLVFSDDESSSHRALIFLSDPEVRVAGRPVISYPRERPLVVENEGSIRVLFPEQVGIELARPAGQGITIVLWTTPAHLSNSSPLLVEHPDWIMWSRDGTPEVAGYDDIVGVGLSTGYLDYSLDRLEQVSRSIGVHGILFDSFLTFGAVTDYGPRQPRSQLGYTLQIEQMLHGLGYSRIDIEGCGLLGLSSGGFPGPEAFLPGFPPDEAAVAALWIGRARGREYGFYRYRADEVVDPDSYYRALASKGISGSPHSLETFQTLPAEQQERITQANHDYLAVAQRMGKRHLVDDGVVWKGVSWTRKGADDEVLFSFTSFAHPVQEGAMIHDITASTSWVSRESFQTEEWHTYLIRPKTRERSPRWPDTRLMVP